jgi:type I restriction enzyme R subunit
MAETKLWDDQFYSSEECWFYTKEELQWLIQKRATIKTFVKQLSIKISQEDLILEAIQRVAETWLLTLKKGICGNKRRALLYMATGKEKTERSSIG